MTETKTRILVWDTPTRVFHWMFALCFAGAYATSESERLIGVHTTLGYTMAGLVMFRLIWGLIGPRYARFTSFLRGPETIAHYVNALWSGKSEHPVGHNPLGAISITLMLLSSPIIVYTGWVYFHGGSHIIKEVHESAAGLMLAIISVHVAGVLLACVVQGENLIASMIHGYKTGSPTAAIRWTWWPIAALVLGSVLGFWWLQWQSPPSAAPTRQDGKSQRHHGEHERHGKLSKHSGYNGHDDGD
ncbi:cytochrome b/b6 domain-containing protein [Rhodoferax sp.]|uniref:cytochrome b/b6 domain-containing protein n=1 Tax=Rhodoferax sp. TaxID=50421 RepID=UPI002601C999|nr:cytochrome b/b6 domain-containing protein [Rhodoferax sp.]MDD2923928.1 cytochrome b/b6 domain-containing protein [Rhodoferax sp.]